MCLRLHAHVSITPHTQHQHQPPEIAKVYFLLHNAATMARALYAIRTVISIMLNHAATATITAPVTMEQDMATVATTTTGYGDSTMNNNNQDTYTCYHDNNHNNNNYYDDSTTQRLTTTTTTTATTTTTIATTITTTTALIGFQRPIDYMGRCNSSHATVFSADNFE